MYYILLLKNVLLKFRNRDLYMTFKPTATEETDDFDEMKEKWVRMTTDDGKIIPGFKVITE